VREIRRWSKADLEYALAELIIDLATRAGKQYDADRESPPRIDDAFHRAIWRVYLQTRNERIARAMGEQLTRHST
jgi:hypothetical protein